jgi:hypothetical protein
MQYRQLVNCVAMYDKVVQMTVRSERDEAMCERDVVSDEGVNGVKWWLLL